MVAITKPRPGQPSVEMINGRPHIHQMDFVGPIVEGYAQHLDLTTDQSGLAPQAPLSGTPRSKPVLDQRWTVGDIGEVALVITLDRPLAVSDCAAIGAVVGGIERLVPGLTRGDNGG